MLGSTNASLLDRTLLWNNALVLADSHFGKTTHFRKAGFPIPTHAMEIDYVRLQNLIIRYEPARVLILGDLFHSEHNAEWDLFTALMARFNSVEFVLVKGNHDILHEGHYNSSRLVVTDRLEMENVIFTHEPLGTVPSGKTNLHGHIHPGIRLKGKGRQLLTVPCFHFSLTHWCLPAFGKLTGLVPRKPAKGDLVFAVLDDKIYSV